VSDKIAHVAEAMQTVLDTVPESAARSTGFIKRLRKLTAPVFVKTLVFGWLADPGAGLEALTRVAALLGSPIKPQSLEERFTPEAAALLLQTLEASLAAVVAADPVPIPLLKRFTEVVVLDSSTVALPESFRLGYAGCGTSNPQAGNAAVKLTVAWDLKGGRLRGPLLDAGRVNDKKAAERLEDLPAGSLRVADLGYFHLDRMAAMTQDGVFVLSRFLPLTVVYDEQGVPWRRLSELLERCGPRVERTIHLRGFRGHAPTSGKSGRSADSSRRKANLPKPSDARVDGAWPLRGSGH